MINLLPLFGIDLKVVQYKIIFRNVSFLTIRFEETMSIYFFNIYIVSKCYILTDFIIMMTIKLIPFILGKCYIHTGFILINIYTYIYRYIFI